MCYTRFHPSIVVSPEATKWFFAVVAAMALVLCSHAVHALPQPGAEVDQASISENLSGVPRQVNDNIRWTHWGSNVYALADDSGSIWIGGVGSVIRYDKTDQTYTRYVPPQPITHQEIHAVAVDSAGNRWFGGDAGLSKLDAAEEWQHFSPENSGIHEQIVVSIAVSADGTIWAGHDLDAGSVSRLSPDGSWGWFPTRSAAVVADYARILETQNVNRLWTISGSEIWVDLSVYNGTEWIEHVDVYSLVAAAESASMPSDRILAADSQGNVYVTDNSTGVSVWDGSAWAYLDFGECVPFDGMVNRVVVDHNDHAWIAWYSRLGHPYTNRTPGFNAIDAGCLSEDPLPPNGPVADMLATDAGLWMAGPGWLRSPAGVQVEFMDGPSYPKVTDLFHDVSGQLWVYSSESSPYSVGMLQRFDDRGTLDLNDDRWTADLPLPVIRTRDVAPGGDLWVAGSDGYRGDFPLPPMRYHAGSWIEYRLWKSFDFAYAYVSNIFVEDDRHTWFAYTDGFDTSGVLRLDDGGTPTNMEDDSVTNYPRPIHGDAEIALDSLGRLWFGDDVGLFRYAENEWQTIRSHGATCDLIPLDDGVMLEVYNSGRMCGLLDITLVVIYGADGEEDVMEVGEFVTQHDNLARQATRATRFWSVASDGSIWYLVDEWVDDIGYSKEIRRFDGTNTTAFPLPVTTVAALSVDSAGQLWVYDGQHLSRLTEMPGFLLRISPDPLLVAAGAGATSRLDVAQINDFESPITLSSTGQPEGMTVTFAQNPAIPGVHVAVQVSVEASVPYDTYELTFTGTSEAISHSTTLAVLVAADRFELYLPHLSGQ